MNIRNLLIGIRNNKLIKSSLVYTIAGLMLKGINFLVFPIFSRILTPEDYGIMNVFSTWVGFMTIFGSMQLNACIPTAKSKFDKNKYDDLIITILSYTTIVFIVINLISVVFKSSISNYVGISEMLIPLITIQSLFGFIIGLYNTVLIQNKEDKKYLIISLLLTISNIVISLLLVLVMRENRYLGRIIGISIATTLIGLILYFRLSKGKFYIKLDLLKFALKLSLPIVPHILSHQLLTNADRIMLNNIKGSISVGIYGFAYNIGMLINIVWGAINNAWVPWYFENMRENNQSKIKEASRNYIMVFTIITILLIFITPELGKILASKEYWSGINIVPLIAFSYFFVFLYSFPVNIQFYKEKTNYIPIGTVLAAIVNLALNYIFIPKYGIFAATISTLISYILLFVFHLLVVKFLLKYKDANMKYYLISSIFVFVFVLLFYITINNLIYRYLILLTLFIFVYIKRNDFIKLLKIK